MAVFDATFAHIELSPVTALANVSAGYSSTSFTWKTIAPGNSLTAQGTGFTYAPGGIPIGGTVNTVIFDWANEDEPLGFDDAIITGLSVSLTELANFLDPAVAELRFWETVLGGNDEIRAPLAAGGQYFGDFANIVATAGNAISRTGGNDLLVANSPAGNGGSIIRGGSVSPNALVGDALFVQGADDGLIAYFAEVTGGNDRFEIGLKSSFLAVGDVQWVSLLGSCTGGDDVFVSKLNILSFGGLGTSNGRYVGDVELNSGGLVMGGDDRITGSNFAFTDEILIGDVLTVEQSGRVVGGADVLSGRSGREFLIGDVQFAKTGVAITGGNDTIRGGGDSDILAGDVWRTQAVGSNLAIVAITGGDDRLYGDVGDDWIVGDVWDLSEASSSSAITGGDDKLFGGDGDDQLWGDVSIEGTGYAFTGGDDTLDGGMGNDLLQGQDGNDTAAFNSIARAVRVDLIAGTATGQGNDELHDIENIRGSSRADQLRGNNQANVLDGGSGDDILAGRNGNDTLIGGAGRDEMTGGIGADTFVFRRVADSGVDEAGRDVISGWDAGDVIDLSAIDANTLLAGDQSFTVITSGNPGAGEVRLVANAAGYLLRINVDGDADIEMTIQVNTTIAITAADFVL